MAQYSILQLVVAFGGDLAQATVTISAVNYDIIYSQDDLEQIQVFGVAGNPLASATGCLYFAH